jgi:hypothetical protein
MLLMPSPNFQIILDRIQEVFLSAQILKSRRIIVEMLEKSVRALEGGGEGHNAKMQLRQCYESRL